MLRPASFLFRVFAVLTATVFLGATALAVHRTIDPGAGPANEGQSYAFGPAKAQPPTLLATHTFAAKPTSLAPAGRGLDLNVAPPTLLRFAMERAGRPVHRPRVPNFEGPPRPSLVGMVELRI